MAQGTGGSSGSIGAVSQNGVWTVGINGGSVTALQSAPFIVSGLSVNVSGSNSVTALQSSVYLVSGTQAVTQSGTWNVGINSGSVSVFGSVPLMVSGVDLMQDKTTFTEGTSRTRPIAGVYNENSTGDLAEDQAGVVRLTSKRGLHVNLRNQSGVEIGTAAAPVISSPQAATSGGWNAFSFISQSTVSGLSIKSTAGQVGGWALFNINASPRYLKIYNTSSAPVVGTTVPQIRLLIPGNTAGGGANVEVANGISFTTGIGIGVTSGITDGDITFPTSNEVIINLLHK